VKIFIIEDGDRGVHHMRHIFHQSDPVAVQSSNANALFDMMQWFFCQFVYLQSQCVCVNGSVKYI